MKTNDKLHWNAYKFFRQEVKREIRLAERTYVRSQIINSKGNTNSIWKVINRCVVRRTQSNNRRPLLITSLVSYSMYISVSSLLYLLNSLLSSFDISILDPLPVTPDIFGHPRNITDVCRKKSPSLPQFNDSHENMANSFNKYFASVESLTALKAN